MADYAHNGDETIVIDRSATGKRFLFTVLFVIVIRLVEAVLAFVVLYELVYTLISFCCGSRIFRVLKDDGLSDDSIGMPCSGRKRRGDIRACVFSQCAHGIP